MTVRTLAVRRAAVADPPPRPRVLLAPVTITPAKPLLPSHLKGLLWTDVMFRATRLLADVTLRSSHTTYDVCEQTAGFWEYLDRTLGDTDYSTCSEEDIGELYVRYRAAGDRAPFAACRPYVEATERHGWVHPASARVLELWQAHYARLGMHDPGLGQRQPPGLGLAEMIDRLGSLGMCLDLRRHGGPVYLDATRDGLPLRQIVAADGRPNYLACALRELLALAPSYDEVVLLYDRELEQDYLLLARALEPLGVRAHRVALGRVPIEGRIRSARHGEWRGHTAGALLDAAASYDPEAVRLGMRMYFIATLGPGDRNSFRGDLLRRCLRRAERLLSGPDGSGSIAGALERHRGEHSYVDPYRLTSGLLAARPRGPVRELLAGVFT
ncbi:hypothetical protein [Actinomadura sp. DC4]|uniref:hypothetical protein n=1 Tax=Actinomadura sp. DC4 TaxID=3055069 RepID=UPI0025AFBA23|nr:hypothetical protein [Actinomadura sp. DC4]MDN3352435.1 hypothetical protein [Actinomadura sp. DC4]